MSNFSTNVFLSFFFACLSLNFCFAPKNKGRGGKNRTGAPSRTAPPPSPLRFFKYDEAPNSFDQLYDVDKRLVEIFSEEVVTWMFSQAVRFGLSDTPFTRQHTLIPLQFERDALGGLDSSEGWQGRLCDFEQNFRRGLEIEALQGFADISEDEEFKGRRVKKFVRHICDEFGQLQKRIGPNMLGGPFQALSDGLERNCPHLNTVFGFEKFETPRAGRDEVVELLEVVPGQVGFRLSHPGRIPTRLGLKALEFFGRDVPCGGFKIISRFNVPGDRELQFVLEFYPETDKGKPSIHMHLSGFSSLMGSRLFEILNVPCQGVGSRLFGKGVCPEEPRSIVQGMKNFIIFEFFRQPEMVLDILKALRGAGSVERLCMQPNEGLPELGCDFRKLSSLLLGQADEYLREQLCNFFCRMLGQCFPIIVQGVFVQILASTPNGLACLNQMKNGSLGDVTKKLSEREKTVQAVKFQAREFKLLEGMIQVSPLVVDVTADIDYESACPDKLKIFSQVLPSMLARFENMACLVSNLCSSVTLPFGFSWRSASTCSSDLQGFMSETVNFAVNGPEDGFGAVASGAMNFDCQIKKAKDLGDLVLAKGALETALVCALTILERNPLDKSMCGSMCQMLKLHQAMANGQVAIQRV